MAIYAHPDDIEFSCSGTLARWADEGSKIYYVVLTSGDVGIDTPGTTREQAAKIREEEQRAAANVIGAEEVVFIGELDGMLVPSLELRKKLVRLIRKFRPEVILTSDPTVVWVSNTYINHPDHRAAGTVALDATFPAAGQPNLFEELEEEGLTAHKPRKVYISTWNEPTHFVNIESTIDKKIEALRQHKSQMKDWDPEERIRSSAAERGHGKEMEYAESFRVITLESDEDWEKRRGHVVPR
jgi:LmbE family N-acetylglucosaminyl deacetylase